MYSHPQCSLSLSFSCFSLLNFPLVLLADKYPPIFSHSPGHNTWILLSTSQELLLPEIPKNMILFVFLDFYNKRYLHKHQIIYTIINRHRSVSKMDHVLEHKANLNKLRIIEVRLHILSVHNTLKIKIFSEQRVIPVSWTLKN